MRLGHRSSRPSARPRASAPRGTLEEAEKGAYLATLEETRIIPSLRPVHRSETLFCHPRSGDLLNARNITGGWFYGDWQSTAAGNAVCQPSSNAHYAPFQYYLSTANSPHRPATSVASIGHTNQANHQYSLDDF
jgi:hypothetical protein